jgi:hypothetical protein
MVSRLLSAAAHHAELEAPMRHKKTTAVSRAESHVSLTRGVVIMMGKTPFRVTSA